MSNRIDKAFSAKEKDKLTIYFTAGYPQLNDTRTILKLLNETDVDIIEIGIPYSDPLADGETIQETGQQALANGMNLATLFEQLKDLRAITDKPVFLMGYCNNVLKYGTEKFCKQCAEVGVDGLILPDMPILEYGEQFEPYFNQHGLKNVFLVTPKTSEARIRQIDELNGGFIYMVSSAATTGGGWEASPEKKAYLQKISDMNLKTPTMVGFGIADNQALKLVNQYTDGAIVGSAFLRSLDPNNLETSIKNFINKMRLPEKNA